MRKPVLIEPINDTFDNVFMKVVGAETVQEPPAIITSQDNPLKKWLNKIHHSNNVELMNRMPAESVSVIVTSPPYNIRNSSGNGLKNGSGGKWPKAELIKGYDHAEGETDEDNLPHEVYVQQQREALTAMMRLLKPDGAIFYNHKWRVQNGLLQDRHDIVNGFPVRQIIIWQRAGGINFNPGYFLPTFEVIYLICKPDFVLTDKANRMTDIWQIPQSKGNPHPAPYPLELASKCIQASPGGVVLDPYMGSGTTALAAIALGREWIGIEKSQKYCNMADERIREYTKRMPPKLSL